MRGTFVTLLLALAASGSPGLAADKQPWELEQWESVPVLTWQPTGEDTGQWLQDGKPTSLKPNRNTDVILPASDKPYVVGMGGSVRHLVVEKNAHVRGGSHAGPMTIWGNVWVKEGGQLHFCNVKGPKHTFFRIDGAAYPGPGDERVYPFSPSIGKHGSGMTLWHFDRLSRSDITHKFQVCKYQGGSVTFIGKFGVGDEIQVQYGTMIIDTDSEFRFAGAAGKACIEVFDGATLELQSGAVLAGFNRENTMGIFQVNVYNGGTLQAGSPERPITRDAIVRLGFGDKPADSGRTGLYAARGSTVRVYSAAPEKARLVFTSMTATEDFYDGKGGQIGDPDRHADAENGIVLHLYGSSELDGVVFDYTRAGGIRLLDPDEASRWRHVVIGPASGGDSLQALVAQGTMTSDIYYHKRKYMRYYLVQKSLSAMEQETGKVNVRRDISPGTQP